MLLEFILNYQKLDVCYIIMNRDFLLLVVFTSTNNSVLQGPGECDTHMCTGKDPGLRSSPATEQLDDLELLTLPFWACLFT